jgi:succinyl-CoA synthetase alpha subunit/predicted peroxiredoxin
MIAPRADADPSGEPYREAVARREVRADAASLRHVFRPDSVAVVGASRRAGIVGRAVLRNVVTGGYQGRVYAVNPHATRMEGVPCRPSVTTLPEPVDLAMIAVPPPAVPAVAGECGRRGVKALVVITAGLDALQGADLLATCRRYGMRLAGPGSAGIAVPGIGLDATFAACHPAPGVADLVMQSGGLGFALVDRLSRLGLGISSFASVGSRYDISSNDMLMWWEQDNTTRLAVLYLESFGNPRKFARTARRAGRRMPVLAVHAGRSAAGQQAAASHTAAAPTPPVARQAALRLADGESLELLTDASEEIDKDIRAWCRARGQELVAVRHTDDSQRYVITKGPLLRSGKRFAAVISDAGLEELLSPLAFALAAALEGSDVSLYFQGPAVRVLARGFREYLHGLSRPFSRFAPAGLTKAGHIPAQEKLGQLQALGAHLYACAGSMQHFKVAKTDLAFDGVTIAEYLTFMEVMQDADINVFV